MDPIAENSSNTLANGGGQVADNDIPKDGTGKLHLGKTGTDQTC